MNLKRNLAAFLVPDFEMERKKSAESFSDAPHHHLNLQMDHNRVNTADNVLKGYNHVMEMEAIIVEDLIKPLMFLFKYFLPFQDTISFDPVARCCVLVKGSFFRKLRCILFQLLILYRLGLKAIPSLNEVVSPAETTKNGVSMGKLAKAAYFIFISFSCVAFYVYWLKTDKVCKILNNVLHLAEKLHLKEQSPPRTKCVKIVVHSSWVFVTVYVMFTVVIYSIQIASLASIKSAEGEGDLLSNSSKSSNEYQLDFTEIHSSDDFILLQIISAFAMAFRQLVAMFYWRIQTKEELGQSLAIPHEIRTFNKIGSIIDEFNQVYGLSIVLGAVVTVAYISPSIKHAFSGLSNVPQLSSGWHLLLSYIPMMTASIIMADTQRMLGSFSNVIKHEFGRFTKECGDPAECLCAIAIVHYDLATSNVGIKGLGFFTVSYQFITTIVSVIISYSILVMQMFPHDNSDIEV